MPVVTRQHLARSADPRGIQLRSNRTAASLFIVLTLLLSACNPKAKKPAEDSFYSPPDGVAAAANGDVLKSRSSRYTLDPVGKAQVLGIKSWQVMYRSTNATGEPIAVTGTVLVPEVAWLGGGNRPLITWAVGTRGLGRNCAPSWTLSQGTDYEATFIQNALNRGWAVVVTDLEGMGTPGPHRYMVGQSAGRSVLDAARAALSLPDAGLAENAPVGIVGYSQGGASGGWAAELAATYAPELNIKGASLGGVPSNLTEVAEGLDGGATVALALMAAMGLDSAYDELDIEAFLNERGLDLLAKSASNDMCITEFDGLAVVLETAFTEIDDYVTTNPLYTPPWQIRLNEQLLGSVAPAFPIYQFHGSLDNMVAYPQGRQLWADWCDAGATVKFDAPLAEHVGAMLTNSSIGLDWMGLRFAGLSATDNCWLS